MCWYCIQLKRSSLQAGRIVDVLPSLCPGFHLPVTASSAAIAIHITSLVFAVRLVGISVAQGDSNGSKDKLNIEACCLAVWDVRTPGDGLHNAHTFICHQTNTFSCSEAPSEPMAQQIIQSTISERVAIFPKNVVRARLEVLQQKLVHLCPTVLTETEEDPIRLGVPAMTNQSVGSCDPTRAEVVLHAIDENGSMIANCASHPPACHAQLDLKARGLQCQRC
mmetsp:Transcript_43064/g.108230  ORF Transcript_43064/g.108230 Transcript_43064/m.108230 type:complete len:222 (+) Transcript_43064:150-815(+)